MGCEYLPCYTAPVRLALSSTDPHSELTVANTTMKQSGRGLLISNGGTAKARECHFEFNEYAGVAVQDPGSKLMMHNCHELDMSSRIG